MDSICRYPVFEKPFSAPELLLQSLEQGSELREKRARRKPVSGILTFVLSQIGKKCI